MLGLAYIVAILAYGFQNFCLCLIEFLNCVQYASFVIYFDLKVGSFGNVQVQCAGKRGIYCWGSVLRFSISPSSFPFLLQVCNSSHPLIVTLLAKTLLRVSLGQSLLPLRHSQSAVKMIWVKNLTIALKTVVIVNSQTWLVWLTFSQLLEFSFKIAETSVCCPGVRSRAPCAMHGVLHPNRLPIHIN